MADDILQKTETQIRAYVDKMLAQKGLSRAAFLRQKGIGLTPEQLEQLKGIPLAPYDTLQGNDASTLDAAVYLAQKAFENAEQVAIIHSRPDAASANIDIAKGDQEEMKRAKDVLHANHVPQSSIDTIEQVASNEGATLEAKALREAADQVRKREKSVHPHKGHPATPHGAAPEERDLNPPPPLLTPKPIPIPTGNILHPKTWSKT